MPTSLVDNSSASPFSAGMTACIPVKYRYRRTASLACQSSWCLASILEVGGNVVAAITVNAFTASPQDGHLVKNVAFPRETRLFRAGPPKRKGLHCVVLPSYNMSCISFRGLHHVIKSTVLSCSLSVMACHLPYLMPQRPLSMHTRWRACRGHP
jgi:hypothetical protein